MYTVLLYKLRSLNVFTDCNNRLNNMLFLSIYSGDVNEALCWDLRVNIALDVAKGLEYLHDGVSFHVI